MASITQLKSGSWRAQIRRKNVINEGKTFEDEAAAREWARQRESDLLSTHIAASCKIEGGPLSFALLVEKYFAGPKFLAKALTTQQTERTKSKPVLEHFGGRSILTMDSPAIQEYFDLRANYKTRLGKSLSGNSLRLEKAFLSNVFAFARIRKMVPQNPMLDTFEMLPCNSREVRISFTQEATLDDMTQHWSRLPRTNKNFMPWLQFVRQTGSRPGEGAKIELAWLNLDEARIDLPRRGTKKRNERLITLAPELVEILKKQVRKATKAGSKFLFWSINPKTRAPVPYAYSKPWARVCKLAGLDKIGGAHSMRHEFISRLYECTTLSDGMIAALAGDVNPLSLAPYRHLRVAALRDRSAEHNAAMAELAAEARKQLEKQREVIEGEDTWLNGDMLIPLADLSCLDSVRPVKT